MDIPIIKKKGIKKKHVYIAIGALLFLLLIYKAFISEKISTFAVNAENLSIDTISKGIFHDYISVTGNVEPIATIFLDVREGGRVEEKFIEEGEIVKKGDIILRLSNPDLSLNILNSEAQLAEKNNSHRNLRNYNPFRLQFFLQYQLVLNHHHLCQKISDYLIQICINLSVHL